jgi:hypothetical protein
MADLYHLLEEIEEQEEPLQTTESDAWELDENEPQNPPEVPPILLEAAQRRQQGGVQDDTNMDETNNDDLAIRERNTGRLSLEDESFAKLKFLWIQEKQSPELLPIDADAIRVQMKRLQEQDDYIESLQASCDLTSLTINMYKIDADRMRFVLTDLMRTRLRKLEEHALYNLREMTDRMTEEEVRNKELRLMMPMILPEFWRFGNSRGPFRHLLVFECSGSLFDSIQCVGGKAPSTNYLGSHAQGRMEEIRRTGNDR